MNYKRPSPVDFGGVLPGLFVFVLVLIWLVIAGGGF